MKPLILLVDDKPQIARIISASLGSDFRTEYFSDGAAALQYLLDDHNDKPSLIVTDINMPEMDGYTLLKHLKSESHLKKIPVVVLSSIESSSDRILLLEAGAADFLLKPFNPEELKLRIKHLLQ